ncbi:MAG TPA: DUF1326 domain-containing protein [Acidobacteriota bacterium]|nr:DUF1326 domain-containing protein [Acidobacteriota bacterium]HNC45874.1 DUF1326 domain-containing protein [Acidobacteriota bacterium]HNG94645.1 DUF1326 domain-containing protein [Acidobacteriota bacterium]HNH82356.1 DUF1326 domain-containing protein [Acidobacteriota bacterium]
MQKKWLATSAMLLAMVLPGFGSEPKAGAISGDYVEARTASVFAGACHYNGEVVTIGRDAILAWNITAGEWNGVSLAGVKAVAVVESDLNLEKPTGRHQSELVVDSAATEAQAQAVAQALATKYAASLGKVVALRRLPVSFEHQASGYKVNAAGFASLTVQPMPNNACCTMPGLVWYAPLVPLQNRKVGYTVNASYEGSQVGMPWSRASENSAFYGTF